MLAVVFVAALVATRDGELLVDVPPDRADLDLPLGAPVTADDLEAVRFGMALRGYRMAEVDALLDRLSGELRDRDARLAELEGSAPQQQPAVEHRPDGVEPQDGPDAEHLPDSGKGAEPLPAVVVRPGASPVQVPFPEPVHVDEPTDPPHAPDAASRAAQRW